MWYLSDYNEAMRIISIHQIAEIDNISWNTLNNSGNPFIKHEFLSAFERGHCVDPESGWVPAHLVALEDQQLLGAMPLYFKSHSWGEFVFDFAWADAYERNGRKYYPKVITAVPYTPATGPRVLVPSSPDSDTIKAALIAAAKELVKSQGASSLHCLFPTQDQAELFESHGFLIRLGCQYHWQNRDYRDFDHFLEGFSAEKRKKVKRERRRVQEAGIDISVHEADEVTPALWQVFYRFYLATVLHKSGYVPLSLEFFQSIGRTLPDSVVLILAQYHGDYVAAALSFRGGDTLYGRYWGASDDFHSLHFELCYYRGIEYCIKRGLNRFEPGAQGEHKISRGFLPTPTYSAHWLADPVFQRAVQAFLERERQQMRYHMAELSTHGPYKSTPQL
jgi:predicted N-acyltransferase